MMLAQLDILMQKIKNDLEYFMLDTKIKLIINENASSVKNMAGSLIGIALNFSMVLAQRQKYRSMEQNRKPRDKSTHIWTPYL